MARPKGDHQKIIKYIKSNPCLSLREYGRRLNRSDKGIGYIYHKYCLRDIKPILFERMREAEGEFHSLIEKRKEIMKQIKTSEDKLKAYKIVYEMMQ